MIQAIEAEQVICDNCGQVIKFGADWSFFKKGDVQDWIENEDYTMEVIDGKHICCACVIYDDAMTPSIDTKRTVTL